MSSTSSLPSTSPSAFTRVQTQLVWALCELDPLLARALAPVAGSKSPKQQQLDELALLILKAMNGPWRCVSRAAPSQNQ